VIRAALLVATLACTPAGADTIRLGKGDVACVSYDAATATCLTKGTVIGNDAARLSYSKESLLGDYDPPHALTMFSQMEVKEGRHCLVPGSIRSAVFPAMSVQAQILSMGVNRANNDLSRLGYCTEYRRCGDLIVSSAWLGGLRHPSTDTAFRLFRAGDPVLDDLRVRPTTFKELNNPVDEENLKCQPIA
jgi:hypothetical protein